MIPTSLVLLFRGWITVRLSTEPDPPDEPRGASGYTFAFAGEPPLDRIIRTQPLDEPEYLRPGAPWGNGGWGVHAYNALRIGDDGTTALRPHFLGMRLQLHEKPKFENRSWLLTPPGWEPIVPFDLAIEDGSGFLLRRSAPLDPLNPDQAWKQPLFRLLAQGARDLWPERETVGNATGIWDALVPIRDRISKLEALRAEERDNDISKLESQGEKERAEERRQCLDSRLYELKYALDHPLDRRVMVRSFVERFSVKMEGKDGRARTIGDDPALRDLKDDLDKLDLSTPWSADFWMGAWDFDLLAAYFQGSLLLPFKRGG